MVDTGLGVFYCMFVIATVMCLILVCSIYLLLMPVEGCVWSFLLFLGICSHVLLSFRVAAALWKSRIEIDKVSLRQASIAKTCLYNFDPLKPHFYIVKLGFTGYTLFILFLL